MDDQAEGQYWVVNGHHYNAGCCFDYGNAETDSRDDGNGTMETTYYGNATAWYHGPAPGPWIMTDQENNLVGCVNASPNDKYLPNLPSINWRFVTATADGEPHHWRSMGGDAQTGDLKVMFDGPRVNNDRNSYDPMRKQGAILLGNGGDNSNGSQGTFYEGAMTAAGTFPTKETNQKIQANVVAARYDVQRLSLAPASATATPAGTPDFLTAILAGYHCDVQEHDGRIRYGRQVEHFRARRGVDRHRQQFCNDRGSGCAGRERERDLQGHLRVRRPSTATWLLALRGRTPPAGKRSPKPQPRRFGTSARSRSTSSR